MLIYLDLKDIISVICIIVGLILKDTSSEIYGKSLIIAGIVGLVAIHLNRLYIRILQIVKPKKMPPPKNKDRK